MKPIFSTLLTAAALMAASTLTSCSSDDDNAPDYAADITGDYACWASMNSGYFSNNISLDQKVSVTKINESTVSVSYISASFGTFTIPEATVTSNGNAYVISGAGTTEMGRDGNLKEYPCTLSASINGNSQSFEFSIPSVMGGSTITLTPGELPADKYCYVVAGSFSGKFTGTSQYFPEGMADDVESTVVVSAQSDGKVTVTCDSETWGKITVTDLVVTRDGDKFSFSGQGKNEMPGMNGGATKEYVCDADCSEDVATGTNDFKFTMPAVMGGLTLTLGE